MFGEELAEEPLMRATLWGGGERGERSVDPRAKGRASVRRQQAAGAREVRAPPAEDSARRVTERRDEIGRDGRMTHGTLVYRRREAEVRDEPPGAGERGVHAFTSGTCPNGVESR